LTKALAQALAEPGAEKRLARHDTDEDGCLSPLELVPDLLTTVGKPGRPRYAVAVKKGAWLDDLLAHYDPEGKQDEKAFEASLARCKTVHVTLQLEAPRQIRRAGGLTLDLAATKAVAEAKGGYTLWVAPQPRGWFEWLDVDQDGQLSLVEIRDARRRLADDKGKLSLPDAKEISYSFTLTPEGTSEYGIRLRRPEGRSLRGPAWFVAMDRNGDGYVSRDEWLGEAEEFKQLDRNGDGLISPTEAEGRK
jgi:hypothetical protein